MNTNSQLNSGHPVPYFRAVNWKPTPILGVFLTVFLDMLSFGMVIPDLQIRAERLGASDLMIGVLLGVFSLMQLLTAPVLGRWSDRVGRRRILYLTALLAALSFVVYANAHAVWLILVSRAIGGFSGANIGVAFAYVADVTDPSERAKGMGTVGAGFGLGFIFGPVFGALLINMGKGEPALLGYFAAALALLNALYIYLYLPESKPKQDLGVQQRVSMWVTLWNALLTPKLGFLLAIFFVANFAFANMESTWFRMVDKVFSLNQTQATYILTWVGVVMAITQGVLLRKLVTKYGEVNLVRAGYLLTAPALLLMPWLGPWIPMLLCSLALGVGIGIGSPSINSLVSRTAPADLQGGVFGVTQALGALARILGPLSGNLLMGRSPWLPYAVAGSLTLIPLLGSLRLTLPQPSQSADAVH